MIVEESCSTSPTGLESYLERLRPLVDNTIEKLSKAKFREDPIAGRKYSRATSIISSAYKRHRQILVKALLERLKDCSRLKVWTEDDFKLSHDSLHQLQITDHIEPLLRTKLPYGDRERSIVVDTVVFDRETKTLNSYYVKRGNGSYDGGKRRLIQGELLRTHMLLADYGRTIGITPQAYHAHIVFYYGLLSLPKPLAIAGNELDAHFRFPVHQAIEYVNDYFISQLHKLIEQEI